MSNVIPFPGLAIATPSRPARIADLPDGAKALVIIVDRDRFAVVMRPALTATERGIRKRLSTHAEAATFARRMSIAFPALYRLILDETPHGVGGAA